VALWVIAVCAVIWTANMMWVGFWKWYGTRYKYSDDHRLLRFVYKVMYGREL
jgi:hypothetical protein